MQTHRCGAEPLRDRVPARARPDGSWTARIFTPAAELPFAGHPTVGAALALADAGLIEGDSVVLHEGVGPVAVAVADGVATLTTPAAPTAVGSADPGDVVAAIGLDLSDLHPELGPRGWSAGVPFTIVAVRDLDALARAEVDLVRWREAVGRSDAPDLYVVTPLDGVRGERWRARMFGPGHGHRRGPRHRRGGRCGCAGTWPATAGEARLDGGWIIEQGVEMGRPSEIRVQGVRRGAELVAVRVGGRAVRVGSGELVVPPT